jgi:hypothetical protein
MNNKFLICLFLCFPILETFAQVGNGFPPLQGETINKKSISIPSDLKGKLTLLGISYSRNSEKILQSWINPIYTEFIEQSEEPLLFDFSYDINIFFIPMISGINQVFSESAVNSMAGQLDEDLKPHVLIYKGEVSSYINELGMHKDDTPYIFVLDKMGKIIHSTSGIFTEDKLDALIELLYDWEK